MPPAESAGYLCVEDCDTRTTVKTVKVSGIIEAQLAMTEKADTRAVFFNTQREASMILGNYNDEPELKKIEDNRLEETKMLESRKEFIEKQLKDFNEDAEKLHVKYWEKIEKFFTDNGRFPKWYSDEKYSIQLEDDGCFILTKKRSLGDQVAEAFMESVTGVGVVITPKGKGLNIFKKPTKKKDEKNEPN